MVHALSMSTSGASSATGVVEIDLVVLVQLHERRGDERLADRAGAEVRVGGDRRLRVAIGEADAAGPLDAGQPHEREARAGDAGVVEDLLHRRLEFVDGLRVGISGLRLDGGRKRRQKKQSGEWGVANGERVPQSDTASSPGTIGRVRGKRPSRAMFPTNARMPTNTTSLTMSSEVLRGSAFHMNHKTGCAIVTAQTEP